MKKEFLENLDEEKRYKFETDEMIKKIIRQQTAQEIFKELDKLFIEKYENTFYEFSEIKKYDYDKIKQKYLGDEK